MSSQEKNLLFEIDGIKIYEGSIYVVTDKPDADAPSGFIKKGISKSPSSGVDESFQCTYIPTSATTGVWDTGFHEYSACYKGQSIDTVKIKVKNLKKQIVDIYEKSIGQEGALDHTNDTFWGSKNFKIFTDKVFNTADPEDRLALYIGLLTKSLTPKELEGDSKYNTSSYLLTDKTKAVKHKDKLAIDLFKAVGIFQELLKNDKTRLLAILNYLDLIITPKADDESIIGMGSEWLQRDDNKKVPAFLRMVEQTETEKGRDTIEVYIKLKESFGRGNLVTKNSKGHYFYKDQEIGADLKSAAQNIAKTKALSEVKKELLFQIEEEIENED